MIRILLSVFVSLIFTLSGFAEISNKNLRSLTVYSTILKENRNLTILLPGEYDATYYNYPVIYMLDAEKNFEMGVEVLSFLMDNHFIPPHIVVGIPNTNRFRDMTPVDSIMNKCVFPGRGGADNFIKTLEVDIFPFVASHFRAKDQRLIIGHNYSGLFSVYVFVKRPDLFEKYLAFSPILWWNEMAIISDLEKFLSQNSSLRKHLFISFAEEAKNMLHSCKSLISILESKSPSDLNWRYAWMPDEDHYSLYRKSLMKGMEAIFSDYKYPDEQVLVDGGIEAAKTYQRNVLLNYGREEKLPYSLLESTSLHLKTEEKFDQALMFLNYTIYNYPERAESYFYIGEIYEKVNQLKEALRFFEIAHSKDKSRWDYEQKFVATQKLIVEIENNTKTKL